MPVPLTASPVALPLVDSGMPAGMPAAANDFAGKCLNVAELLVEHPHATFVLRVAGPSMQEYGIDDGDIVVVDRALRARDGSVVVALVDSDFTIRVLDSDGGTCKLRAGSPSSPDIAPKEGQAAEIWGVVTSCIKRFAR
ncbi:MULTISPECIES: LexA family protein [Comamonas]|uniref:LexA family protein n=1 Tax=Comamonas TaxID=283 RepID=UPI0025C00442|nr:MULTISPECIES: translesion error-prone DNA polymerase V autoproteolytic subunit [Comamonas]MEB5964561.1 translesion error-prone DNA polymerase V autoproteolytic subunit [Comamonas testosteroni]